MTPSLASPDPVLLLDDVSLTLQGNAGPVPVLRSISVSVAAGSSLGLIGPSGSGKSSLLMVMAGLERASSGTITALGHDMTVLGEDALAEFRRDHMGVVFQSFHLIPTMTALENTALPMELAGNADAFDRARDMLGQVGLGARTDHYPSQMSGGEQQRTALARALAPQPALVFADEPTGNLDATNGERVVELLFDLTKQAQSTLVVVTHDPALAQGCDRVLGLRDGALDGERN